MPDHHRPAAAGAPDPGPAAGGRGRCLCGAVVYALTERPIRTTICHCRFCQRATGGPYLILPIAPKTALRLRQGTTRTHTHVSEGSGKAVHIQSCERCATNLWMTWERWPDMVGLFGGTLDAPGAVDLDPMTTRQIFVASARPGTVLPAGIPAYWDHATAPDGTPATPFVLDLPTAVEDLARG